MNYEFVKGDTITINRKTLHRIRAIRDFGLVGKGDLGGYIESEFNLDGNAWVDEGAFVFGDARVYGDAIVCGDARVVENNIFVASNVGSENGTLTVFKSGSGDLLVTRGCFYGTDEEFLEQVRKNHAGTRYQTEYELLIQVARSRILGE